MRQLDGEGRLHYPDKLGGRLRRKDYLDEGKGAPVQDVWTDVKSLSGSHAERLGYPTQKPLSLLKRIIAASSNPGDVVLDPFCGCGTAIDAAEELGRAWRGIDVTHLAIEVITARLRGRFDLKPGKGYALVGVPRDVESARKLAKENPDQFELWALRLIGALPWEDLQKKGADKGRDGVLVWRDTEERIQRHAVVSVKGGQNIGPDMVRDLIGTVETEQTEMGVLITMKKPTKPMTDAADAAGKYQPKYSAERVRKIQILTVEDLLTGAARMQLPQGSLVISQKLPARAERPAPVQKEMTLLTKVPDEPGLPKASRVGAKRKATA
jgi:site-specific DNA-methyltransferase (adenine-specific)